ncbi:MAG: hypothetical protein JW713_06480 [Pontiellaceae bacterium]|nr:hypothetical protein [Pontiellaceae bacterium]
MNQQSKAQSSTVHPSLWTIRRASRDDKGAGSKSVLLPCASPHKPIKVSSAAFHAIMKEWYGKGGKGKSNKAGDFAQCLRELNSNNVDLTDLRGVKPDVEIAVHHWLELYELAVAGFKHQSKKSEETNKQVAARLGIGVKEAASLPLIVEYEKAALSGMIAGIKDHTTAAPEKIAYFAREYAKAMMEAQIEANALIPA